MKQLTLKEHAKNFYPASRVITPADAPHMSSLWKDMIPSSAGMKEGAKVLLYGPPSAGKTFLVNQMLNAISTGKDFLGKPTVKSPCLFISMDMSKGLLFQRWISTNFASNRDMDFWYCGPFNCLGPSFAESTAYEYLEALVQSNKYGLVVFDALRDVHHRSMNDDDAPHQVYDTFQKWMPNTTVMFIHHTRKTKFGPKGTAIHAGDEDALGSRYWSALATVSIGMQPFRRHLTSLFIGKSQVFELPDHPMRLYHEPVTHEFKVYDHVQANKEKDDYESAVQTCTGVYDGVKTPNSWNNMTAREQREALCKELGIDEKTLRRYKIACTL